MRWTLHALAAACGVSYDGPDRPLSGVSIDSRTIGRDAVFIALSGTRQDGHAFVPEAFRKGAAAAVVRADYRPPDGVGPLLRVPDPLRALQDMASAYRDLFPISLIGITGSNGKTTTKEMIASVLAKAYHVGRSPGNLNNHLGVPLSILNWPDTTDIAVIEMGTNHFGEIARLCAIARPTHGVITSIGKAHLEAFGSPEGVLRAKTELLDGLTGPSMAFPNGDDPLLVGLSCRPHPIVFYGFSHGCSVRGEDLALQSGCAIFRVEGQVVRLRVPGRHQASNALAAWAVGRHFGLSAEAIAEVLNAYLPVEGRMSPIRMHGILFLNDAYNANPSSVTAALTTLVETEGPVRRFVVLGDMAELGDRAQEEHRQIGRFAAGLGIDGLIGVGPLMEEAVREARSRGLQAWSMASPEEAADHLTTILRSGDGVLIKGSRMMRLERVLSRLRSFWIHNEEEP